MNKEGKSWNWNFDEKLIFLLVDSMHLLIFHQKRVFPHYFSLSMFTTNSVLYPYIPTLFCNFCTFSSHLTSYGIFPLHWDEALYIKKNCKMHQEPKTFSQPMSIHSRQTSIFSHHGRSINMIKRNQEESDIHQKSASMMKKFV